MDKRKKKTHPQTPPLYGGESGTDKTNEASPLAPLRREGSNGTDGMSEAEIKAASDRRRAARKRQRIRIHAGSIENLDKTEEEARKQAVDVKETGYRSQCRVYYKASRWNWLRKVVNSMTCWAYAPGKCMLPMVYVNRVEMKRNFVKNKVVTRCVTVFLGKDRGRDKGLILQPVPMEYLNRMAVEHVEEKRLGWLRRYPFYADLNSYSAVELLRCAGVNPLVSRDVKFRLVEITGKDRGKDLKFYYRMEPAGKYVPASLGED